MWLCVWMPLQDAQLCIGFGINVAMSRRFYRLDLYAFAARENGGL
jgi:hypothetical protein